ncbi:hypothetical protein, partial [Klebsiella pneumoniae]|uniref:hypothetical protein n=1 Tax=Klebsiella pneumoniae TaxID=573 RepID=UPI003851F676
ASVAVTKHGQIAVAYSLEGSSGTIHMRFRFSGQSFGPAIPVVNLSKMGLVASSDLNCYAPALALHESSNTIYLAFWMGGKILMTKV